LNCQFALAWCLLRWSLPCGDQIQKLPSFSMTGATRPLSRFNAFHGTKMETMP
jgi:hypothetical protein